MTKNEKVTISCSIIAICLSLVTSYFQFFHSSTGLMLNIESKEPPVNHVEYDSVFINTGSDFIVVSSIEGYVFLKKQNTYYTEKLPMMSFVVEPKKMIQKNITHELPYKIHLASEKAISGIEVSFVDYKGKKYKKKIDLIEISPISEDKPYQWISLECGCIDLFKNAEEVFQKGWKRAGAILQ